MEPTVKLDGEAGINAMEDKVTADVVEGVVEVVAADVVEGVVEVVDAVATTVKVTAGLVIPSRVAAILAVPTARPVAKPLELIVAVDGVSVAQAAWELMSIVEPSEYVAVAVNCCVEPTVKLAGEAGVTAMEFNVGVVVDGTVDVDFDEQAVMTTVSVAINPKIMH